MTSQQDVVFITGADGQERPYIKVAPRLKQFLEEFRLKDGWAIEYELLPPSAIYPALALLEKAGNVSGADVVALAKAGFIPSTPVAMYRAKLVNPQGRVVNSADAVGLGGAYKQQEVVQTAALQRLVALCGYPGSDLEMLENLDMSRVPGTQAVSDSPSAKPAPKVVVPLHAVDEAVEPLSKPSRKRPLRTDVAAAGTNPESHSPTAADDHQEPTAKPAREENPASEADTANAPKATPQLKGLQQQVAILARNLQVDTSQYDLSSIEGAQAALAQLFKLRRNQ